MIRTREHGHPMVSTLTNSFACPPSFAVSGEGY